MQQRREAELSLHSIHMAILSTQSTRLAIVTEKLNCSSELLDMCLASYGITCSDLLKLSESEAATKYKHYYNSNKLGCHLYEATLRQIHRKIHELRLSPKDYVFHYFHVTYYKFNEILRIFNTCYSELITLDEKSAAIKFRDNYDRTLNESIQLKVKYNTQQKEKVPTLVSSMFILRAHPMASTDTELCMPGVLKDDSSVKQIQNLTKKRKWAELNEETENNATSNRGIAGERLVLDKYELLAVHAACMRYFLIDRQAKEESNDCDYIESFYLLLNKGEILAPLVMKYSIEAVKTAAQKYIDINVIEKSKKPRLSLAENEEAKKRIRKICGHILTYKMKDSMDDIEKLTIVKNELIESFRNGHLPKTLRAYCHQFTQEEVLDICMDVINKYCPRVLNRQMLTNSHSNSFNRLDNQRCLILDGSDQTISDSVMDTFDPILEYLNLLALDNIGFNSETSSSSIPSQPINVVEENSNIYPRLNMFGLFSPNQYGEEYKSPDVTQTGFSYS